MVGGSIPLVGSIIEVEGYPSGQRGQTVNLLANAYGGSNPPPSTIFSICRKADKKTQ
jgi:hypothetical protein